MSEGNTMQDDTANQMYEKEKELTVCVKIFCFISVQDYDFCPTGSWF